ncbi:MAG: N-acetylmuramoyl-L-alanine amidase [Lachnospiraceae bacterium]|nr:N-acetylmuramoyl-L-alanine amidase [Lachnospiraceae bacterium]
MKRNLLLKTVNYIVLLSIFLLCLITGIADRGLLNVCAAENDADGDVIKICIDPGHGGENEGALWDDYVEKDMTMIVAEAMRDELEKYSGIEVFMTRTSDVDMSLEDRVKYATDVGADFFFCLHFNMSVDHDMYGAECWISAFGENYARAMDFSRIEMQLLTDTGLYDRGIKTRLNGRGTNYYGVLRVGDLEGIPGVIIEHCHLDHAEDQPYYDHYDKLIEYGKLDATAVALYYGLKSDGLGVDYSGYSYEHTPIPDSVVSPDDTSPAAVAVEFGDVYEDGGTYRIKTDIYAEDPDSRMLYYSYSTDGGIHWSDRFRWENENGIEIDKTPGGSTAHVSVPLSTERDMYVVFRVYNLFNLYTESEPYYVSKYIVEEEEREATDEVEYTEIDRTDTDPGKRVRSVDGSGPDLRYMIIVAVFCLCILVVLIILTNVIYRMIRDNSHGRRRR